MSQWMFEQEKERHRLEFMIMRLGMQMSRRKARKDSSGSGRENGHEDEGGEDADWCAEYASLVERLEKEAAEKAQKASELLKMPPPLSTESLRSANHPQSAESSSRSSAAPSQLPSPTPLYLKRRTLSGGGREVSFDDEVLGAPKAEESLGGENGFEMMLQQETEENLLLMDEERRRLQSQSRGSADERQQEPPDVGRSVTTPPSLNLNQLPAKRPSSAKASRPSSASSGGSRSPTSSSASSNSHRQSAPQFSSGRMPNLTLPPNPSQRSSLTGSLHASPTVAATPTSSGERRLSAGTLPPLTRGPASPSNRATVSLHQIKRGKNGQRRVSRSVGKLSLLDRIQFPLVGIDGQGTLPPSQASLLTVEAVCERVGKLLNFSPQNIRLTLPGPDGIEPRSLPLRSSDAHSIREWLFSDASMPATVDEEQTAPLRPLFYELLDRPLVEAESCRDLVVHFFDLHAQELATLPLMIDESSTVEDLLKLVAREMDLRDRSEQLAACSDESRSSASSDRVAATRQQPSVTSDAWRKATGVLRLLVTHEGRIERVHRADDTIDMLMSSDVRVEEIPWDELPENLKEESTIIECGHYCLRGDGDPESRRRPIRMFGDPFLLLIPCNTTFANLWLLIQEKLAPTQATWTLAILQGTNRLPFYFEPGDTVLECMAKVQQQTGLVNTTPCIGLQHAHPPKPLPSMIASPTSLLR